jgi:hypothetical protein
MLCKYCDNDCVRWSAHLSGRVYTVRMNVLGICSWHGRSDAPFRADTRSPSTEERKLCLVLEEIAKEVGVESITSGALAPHNA